MGCKWCVLGNKCEGPDDIDDLGANCGCSCHEMEEDEEESESMDLEFNEDGELDIAPQRVEVSMSDYEIISSFIDKNKEAFLKHRQEHKSTDSGNHQNVGDNK